MQQLNCLQAENQRFINRVADLSLDQEALLAMVQKCLELTGLRAEVAIVRQEFRVSDRRACELLELEGREKIPERGNYSRSHGSLSWRD